MSSFRLHFPALLLVLAMVLLPFGRMVEIPLGILALAGLFAVLRVRGLGGASHGFSLVIAIAAFSVPMLLALPDAIAQQKSLVTSLGTLRYGFSCAALLCWYQWSSDQENNRAALLNVLGLAVAVLLTVWCLDGLLQFVTGKNVLGYGVGEGYINGVFGDDDNIKFGIAVAFLLPIGLVHALRNWPTPAVGVFLLLVLSLIVLSGKRAAWISAAVELMVLGGYYFFRGRLSLKRAFAAVGVVLLALGLAYQASDWVRERSVVIVAALDEPDYVTLNRATGLRLPIWQTAVAIGSDHWINGVGPRGFRYAYAQFAVDGDRWALSAGEAGGARASHAHQLLLELWSETGVFGLLGYAALLAVLWSAWQKANPAARSRALPYGVTLVGVLFPLNTHLAWYSSWHALLLWFFIGVYLLALSHRQAAEIAE